MEKLVDLARAARDGGRSALEALLRESAGVVHALARARLGDSLAAESATVDALARAARGFPKLRDPQAYPHWLYRIAIRCAADARSSASIAPPIGDPADQARGPVDTLVAAERAAEVRAAIEALPARLREPVFLHHVDGLPYRAVAEVLGVGLATVGRRMTRAHSILRRTLGGES